MKVTVTCGCTANITVDGDDEGLVLKTVAAWEDKHPAVCQGRWAQQKMNNFPGITYNAAPGTSNPLLPPAPTAQS